MIITDKGKNAKENNDLEIVCEILPESVSLLELLIENVDIPELNDDLESLLSKLKELANDFEQGNGSFKKVDLFELVVLELVVKIIANF